jgi:valyl-tRNA synthetase
VTVLDERGVVTAPGPFQGLDRFEARPAVVAALREQSRIVAEKRPYVHSVGHCSRCATTVEPRLSLQWFVRVESLAKAAGDAVRDGRVGRSTRPRWRVGYFAGSTTCTTGAISRSCVGATDPGGWYGPSG